MENRAAHQDEGGASSSAGSSAELSRVLREIELLQYSKGLTEEECDQLCEKLKSSLHELKEKTCGKEETRDAEGPSTSRAPSDEQMEELQESEEKMESKRRYTDEATSTDPSGESAKRPRSSQKPVAEEDLEKLHSAIKKEDLETVKGIVDNHAEEQFFSLKGTSALFKAYSCKEYKIAAFLFYRGAEPRESEYSKFEKDFNYINNFLCNLNRKTEHSCIYHLLSYSQTRMGLNYDQEMALRSMYDGFLNSSIIKVLMRVLESHRFDIVYDFEFETVNRICMQQGKEGETFGVTMLGDNIIFVGAKNLLSKDSKNTYVYGVVAEEICHLAMKCVFNNCGKPYEKCDHELEKEFQEIAENVKLLRDCPEIESEIKNVFDSYNSQFWHAELIARVPHIVGIYGEEKGKEKFKQFPQLKRLLDFYEQNVHEKCTQFIDASSNTKYHEEMKQLMRKDDFISFKEMQTRPLKKDFKSFRGNVLSKEGISIISTNCVKLCTLHVYHELKKQFKVQLEKCLFFKGEIFIKERREITELLKHKDWDYLIISINRKDLNMSILEENYIYYIKDFTTKGLKLILNPCLQKLDRAKHINYKWDDLSDQYRKLCLEPMEYIFNGERNSEYCSEEDVLKYFSEEEIISIMNREQLEAEDGGDVHYQGYNPETYIERKFQVTTFEKDYLKQLPSETKVFLSGWKKRDLKDLPFDEQLVKWLEGPNDEIMKDKSVFIIHEQTPKTLKGFESNKNWIWLHYDENEFYVRHSNSSGDVFSQGLKQKTLKEEDILSLLKRKNVIVSDNAGYGKSTVVSSLIDNAKKNDVNSRNWRINCCKFTFDEKDTLSGPHTDEKNKDEEDLESFLILGLKSGLERLLFKKFMDKGQVCLFFDGFDEIPSEYIDNALRILSIASKISALKMLITTRKHHQEELEKQLDTYSHQLSPVSKEEQKTYLDKFWKIKLRNPLGERIDLVTREKVVNKIRSIRLLSQEGKTILDLGGELMRAMEAIEAKKDLLSINKEIANLNFKGLAITVIDKNSMDKDAIEFMGIPLHLFMVGDIYFNSNFEVNINSGIYCIYSEFIQKKIMVYMEEKGGLTQNGWLRDNVIKMLREFTNRIHIDLSKDLLNYGKLDVNLKELCKGLGIVCIKGENVEFLHYTFAEFFRAESIRIRLNEEKSFKDVLFEDKFAVVRRFLENSLKENNFENISGEFFEDFGFFLNILKKFVEKYSKLSYRDELQFVSSAKIIQCLFQKFENTVDSYILDAFVQKIESELKSLKYWYFIGGCVTVKMIKMLINRNFKDNWIIVFGMVAINSEWTDVIKILDKCISTSDKRNEREKVENVLEILMLKGVNGNSLFDCAVLNVRIEVFVRILEYSKKMLGNEKFIKEIIKSEKYREAMDYMIDRKGFNKSIEVIKTFHSVFRNEIEMYFEEIHKIRIIGKSLKISDNSRNAFEEAIELIIEYFGIENLKKTLISCDYYGNYLIHYLVYYNINVIENHLNIVKKYLKDKMKQFLMFKNKYSSNVFHLAAELGNFGEILTFCCKYLEKKEIKEMLISCDEYGENVLHTLFRLNSSEIIIEILNIIKNYLNDEESFKKILKSKDKYSWNIFHLAAKNGDELNYTFLNSHLSKSEIKNLLIERDEYGQTCLHLGANCNSKRILILLNYSFEIMKDNQIQFKELILAKEDKDKNTFLHKVAESNNFRSNVLILIDLIKSLKEKVSNKVFKELLRIRNKRVKTFLQTGMMWNGEIIKEMEKVLEKEFIKELL